MIKRRIYKNPITDHATVLARLPDCPWWPIFEKLFEGWDQQDFPDCDKVEADTWASEQRKQLKDSGWKRASRKV